MNLDSHVVEVGNTPYGWLIGEEFPSKEIEFVRGMMPAHRRAKRFTSHFPTVGTEYYVGFPSQILQSGLIASDRPA